MLKSMGASFVLSFLFLFCSLAKEQEALNGKKVIFLIGEHEYGTPKTLPEFARRELDPLGVKSTFIFAESNDRSSPQCHEFKGLAALDSADLLVISIRRRYPTVRDLQRIRTWIDAGKPVVAIRTSSHAFGERKNGEGYQAPEGHAAWNTFDVEVLGASYQGHHGSKKGQAPLNVPCTVAKGAEKHPVLSKLDATQPFRIGDKLYRYVDVDPAVQVLLEAQHEPSTPVYPVAWMNEKGGKQIFYMSMGGVEEMGSGQVKAVLSGAIQWALKKKADPETSKVERPSFRP